MRSISISTEFAEEFIGLAKSTQRSCLRTINMLRVDPRSKGYKYQGSRKVWLAKVWPYRLFFTYSATWIHVFKIAIRQGSYDQHIDDPAHAPKDSEIPLEIDLDDDTLDLSKNEMETDSRYMTYREILEICEQEQVPDENVAVLADWDRSDSMMDTVLDMQLPDQLGERLYAEWVLQKNSNDRRSANVRLIQKNVISSFFYRVENLPSEHLVNELNIVSPWITNWKDKQSTFDGMLKTVNHRKIPTKVVTLPPTMPNHIAAIKKLENQKSISVFRHSKLHAKFYICDAAPTPFALVASANSTQNSTINTEVGVLIKGNGELEGFIRELQSLAIDLMVQSV